MVEQRLGLVDALEDQPLPLDDIPRSRRRRPRQNSRGEREVTIIRPPLCADRSHHTGRLNQYSVAIGAVCVWKAALP